jgi:hypothetical protein
MDNVQKHAILYPIGCSRGNVKNEECYCVGFEVVTPVVVKNSVFWDITQCSPVKVSSAAFSSALKMEATCCSEWSVDHVWGVEV